MEIYLFKDLFQRKAYEVTKFTPAKCEIRKMLIFLLSFILTGSFGDVTPVWICGGVFYQAYQYFIKFYQVLSREKQLSHGGVKN